MFYNIVNTSYLFSYVYFSHLGLFICDHIIHMVSCVELNSLVQFQGILWCNAPYMVFTCAYITNIIT